MFCCITVYVDSFISFNYIYVYMVVDRIIRFIISSVDIVRHTLCFSRDETVVCSSLSGHPELNTSAQFVVNNSNSNVSRNKNSKHRKNNSSNSIIIIIIYED